MVKQIITTALCLVMLLCSSAVASEFDGWTVRQIRKHKDFVRDTTSMSSTFNTANKGGRRVYHWIGYIPVGDTRVYFTSFGEPLTCVWWEKSGEWVPQWASAALDRLETEGYIKLNPTATTTEQPAEVEVETAVEMEAAADEATAEAEIVIEAEPTVTEEVTATAEVTVSESAGS